MSEERKSIKAGKLVNKNPDKRLLLTIKEQSVKTEHIADNAITPQKVSPDAVQYITADIQNQIDSIQIGGWAISNQLGNDSHIGISQKTLTELIGYDNVPDSIRGRIQKVEDEIGTDTTSDSLSGRITSLEGAVGTGGSVDARIEQAKSQVVGNATVAYDTLGKVESRIQEEATARNNAVEAEISRAQTAESTLDTKIDNSVTNINAKISEDVTTERNRAMGAEELLRQAYEAISQFEPIIGTLPSSGVVGKVYRVPGTTSYSDYMWNGSQFVKMAEYDNATDDLPIADSNNLVKSGGVSKVLEDSKRITGTDRQTFEYHLEVGKTYTFVNHGDVASINVGNSSEYSADTFITIVTLSNEESFTYTPLVEYTYISLYSGIAANKDIFIYPHDSIVEQAKRINEIDIAKVEAGISIKFDGDASDTTKVRKILPLTNGIYTMTNLSTAACSFNLYTDEGEEVVSYGNVRAGQTVAFNINNISDQAAIVGGFCNDGYHAVLRKIDSSLDASLYSAPYGENMIDLLKSKGVFSIVYGGIDNYVNRCQENELIVLPYDCIIDSGDNYNVPYFYDPVTMALDTSKPIEKNHISFIPRNNVFRFAIAGANDEITYTMEELLNSTTMYRHIPSNEKIINGAFNSLLFEFGSLGDSGDDTAYDSKCRIRTIQKESFDFDLTISSHNYKIAAAYFDLEGNFTSSTGWQNTINISAGTLFRLLIANISREYTPFGDLLLDVSVATNDTMSDSEVPVYYKDYLAERTKTILNDTILKKDGNGDNFFFLTDTHFQDEGNNAGQSGKLIDYLAGRVSMMKVIHGGDTGIAYKTEGKTGTEYIMKSIGWCTEKLYQYVQKYGFLNVHGNHDYNNFYEEGGEYVFRGLPIPNVRNFILGTNTLPYTVNSNDDYGMYYYYDNTLSKIRYIIIDSEYNSASGTMRMGSYQLPWIHEAVTSVPSGYDFVFVAHCPIEETVDTSNERTPFADLLTYIRAINNHRSGTIGSISYNFTNTVYKVIMVLAGHTHADIETFVDNVFHVSTKCDKIDTSYPVESPFDAWAERKNGTINEQAFDAITIYNNHSGIQFRRIGDGTDRLFHTEKIELSVGSTIDLSSNIEITASRWVTNDSTGNSWTRDNGWNLSNTVLSVTSSGIVTANVVGDAFVFAEAEDGTKEFFYIQVV